MDKKRIINFNQLSFVDKALMVTEFGTPIMAVNHCGYIAHLYAIGFEFVECMYNVQTKVFEYIGLATYSDLNKYANAIDIDDLTDLV